MPFRPAPPPTPPRRPDPLAQLGQLANLLALRKSQERQQRLDQLRTNQEAVRLVLSGAKPKDAMTAVGASEQTLPVLEQLDAQRKIQADFQKQQASAQKVEGLGTLLASPQAQGGATPQFGETLSRSLSGTSPETQQAAVLRAGEIREERAQATREQLQSAALQQGGGTEFERLIRRLDLDPETERRLIEAKLTRQLAGSPGLDITLPDGTRITQGQASLKANEQKLIDRFVQSTSMVEDMREMLMLVEADLSRAGAFGAVSSAATNVVGILEQFASEATGTKVGEFATNTLDILLNDPNVDPKVKDRARLILEDEEAFGRIDAFESALSYMLARARDPSGRLSDKDVELASRDLQTRRLQPPKRLLARLRRTLEEMERSQRAAKIQLDRNRNLSIFSGDLESTLQQSEGDSIPTYRLGPTGELERVQ